MRRTLRGWELKCSYSCCIRQDSLKTETTLPQITYIFGAGASAQALPTIKGLPDRIKFVRDFIEKEYLYDDNEFFAPLTNITFKKNEAKAYLLDGLEKLYFYSHNHSTIDTYAKKLYISGTESEIDELVFFLSFYFNIEQKLVGVDPRYETFLVSILNSSSSRFPGNMKFLSWNYDLQMEIAHHIISKGNEDDIHYNLFNTDPDDFQLNQFVSFKLNGSCNVRDSFRSRYSLIKGLTRINWEKDDLDFALQFAYTNIKNRQKIYKNHVNINFAWYHDFQLINKVCATYEQTDILVVIGYSFPFFNREVDRKIIRSMVNLKTIYIQDCAHENVKSRFLSILPDWEKREIRIIPVNDVSEFFLPPEL